MKSVFISKMAIAMMALTCFCFLSCGGDDDEESNDSPKNLVGYWTTDQFKSGGKYPHEVSFILFEENIIRYSSDGVSYYINENSWNYNSATGILATNATIRNMNLQWEVTIVDKYEWSGLALWTEDKAANTQKFGDDIQYLVGLLLLDTTWEDSNGKYITFGSDVGRVPHPFLFSGTATSNEGWHTVSYNQNYNKSEDKLTFSLDKWNYYKVEIVHPFSRKKSVMTVSGDGFNLKNGTYKFSSAKIN